MHTAKSNSKKIINIILAVVLALAFSILVFAATTILFTVVCNYESFDITALAGLPLYLFVAEIFGIIFYEFRIFFARRNIVFHKRYYALIELVLSALGIIASVLTGTVIYDSFLIYRIIPAYPLVSLIINVIVFVVSAVIFMKSSKFIEKNHMVNTYKMTAKHVFKTIGYVIILWYSLDRLGAFLLMPIYYSVFDSAATIPYLIQCIVPIAIVAIAFINKRFLYSRKFAIISFSIIFGYSLFSMLFLLLTAKNTTNLIINSFSIIQHLERLIKFPIDLVLMYAITLIVPVVYIINAIWIMPHKANTAKDE